MVPLKKSFLLKLQCRTVVAICKKIIILDSYIAYGFLSALRSEIKKKFLVKFYFKTKTKTEILAILFFSFKLHYKYITGHMVKQDL